MTAKLGIALATVVALAIAALLATASAQPFMGPGMMGPGMMGPWMMGRHGPGPMCNPGMTGFAEWRTERLADELKLTDAQRAKFDEFKAASAKAGEAMRSLCTADVPATIVARTEAMENRMDAMLQAIRTMRPALEAFYATLNDDQKAKLDSGRGPGFWRWRDHW